MSKVDVYNIKGKKIEEIALDPKVFGLEGVSLNLVSLVARVHQNNKRLGLASTKEKHAVRGGGAKPFKQKGTGRARQGSKRAPQFIGGGVVFGPRGEDNYTRKLPRKIAQKALFAVLSDKVKSGAFAVIDYKGWKGFSTKEFKNLVAELPAFRKGKFVMDIENHKEIISSGRNVEKVTFTTYNRLPVDELLASDYVFFDLNAMQNFLDLYKVTK